MPDETSSADHAVVVMENRNPEGRKRPYQVLRAMAKVYTIFAPLMAAILLYNAVAAWFIEETLFAKAMTSLEFSVKAVVAFIVLRGAAQMIYLVFDIARGMAQLCEERQS
jgi:hypothetical protein